VLAGERGQAARAPARTEGLGRVSGQARAAQAHALVRRAGLRRAAHRQRRALAARRRPLATRRRAGIALVRLAVCLPQVPFERGGAEIAADDLVGQLRVRGHEAELVTVPYKWYP